MDCTYIQAPVSFLLRVIFVPCEWMDLAEILGYVFVILSTFQSIV